MTTSPPKSFRRGIDWKNWWVIGRDSAASVSMSNGEYVFVGRAGMRMKWKSWIIIRRPRIYLRIVTIAMHVRISGVAGAYPRSIYRGSGYTDEELQRPLIGVGTAYFEGHPAARALDGAGQGGQGRIWMAGGTPVQFYTIAVCDALARGSGMKYSLPSREVVAVEVEIITGARGKPWGPFHIPLGGQMTASFRHSRRYWRRVL